MSSLTERLLKDTEGLKEFFSSHERVFVYAHMDRVLSEQLIYLLNKLGLKPEGFILEQTSSDDSTVCGYPAKAFDSVELNKSDGVIIAAPEEVATILNLKVKDKSDAIDTYCLKSFGKHKNIPNVRFFVDPKSGFFGRFQELDGLGIKYGTDKSSDTYDYLRKYELFFQYFREEKINVLELGVFRGESMYAFGAPDDGYFKNARVIGADITPGAEENMPNPKNFLLLDASIEELLEKLKVLNPSIVIDDASHLWSHQIKALFILWDFIPSGGLYIIENINTSFKNSGFEGFDDANVSAFEICRDISEIVTGGSFIDEKNHPFIKEVTNIAEETDMISFINGSCIIVKK